MKGTRTGYESDFPRAGGTCKEIRDNDGQVTVTSSLSLTGDHAALILEYMVNGAPWSQMVDLTAATGLSGALGSAAGSNDANIIAINEYQPDSGDSYQYDASRFSYTSYDMNDSQRLKLQAAIRRFKEKAAQGRYTYRLAGGMIGRVLSMPGQRGVNCADFVIKVLGEAGIAKLKSGLISTPIGVSKRRGSPYVDHG